jgi:2-amino-4-hydroxy-6-hydroxymethyldihydropteridine diphosphokinase
MTRAYVGLGSNLAGPERQLHQAFSAMALIPSTRVLRQSSLYRSRPMGPKDQPDYLNACAELDTGLTAHALLQELQQIESRQGRVRDGLRWGPRTLDLDLLMYGNSRIEDETLIVPHPEIPNRGFVLAPLAEIAPELQIPGMGHVQDLLETVGTGDVARMPDA